MLSGHLKHHLPTQGAQWTAAEIKEIHKNQGNGSRNHPFSRSVLGLQNASFGNRDKETNPFAMILGGTFLIQLGNAKFCVFPITKHFKMWKKNAREARVESLIWTRNCSHGKDATWSWMGQFCVLLRRCSCVRVYDSKPRSCCACPQPGLKSPQMNNPNL